MKINSEILMKMNFVTTEVRERISTFRIMTNIRWM